jgi:hypothetical protein
MSTYSLDDLFVLAEETPFLEKLGQDGMDKLLQDVGVQIDREMTGYDPSDPAPGPETARLNAEYEPVTPERVHSTLKGAYAALGLSQTEDAERFKRIMEKLQISVTPPPASRPATVRQIKP